ncbi:hypothetical protein JCM21900_000869 [Sporobolomyces salmonicolor]
MAQDEPYAASATPQHGAHRRLNQLARSSTTDNLASLPGSPSTSRSTRNLGSIGGRHGSSYSPYSRRVSRPLHQEREHDEDESGRPGSDAGDSPSQSRTSGGLFGKVKSLPGKAFGWLTRSQSSRSLASSTSLADVRAAVEEEQAREDQRNGASKESMPRSRTTQNLAGAPSSSALPSHLRRQHPLASSSSMSALSSIASPFSSGQRSSHLTLNLPSATSSDGNIPAFLTATNLSRHSRAASPALSSASHTHSRRSPSPMRNGRVGSMSAYNLAQPRSPTSASAIFGSPQASTLGNGLSGSNPFGLTSRSPFVAREACRVGSARSPSIAGIARSVSSAHAQRGEGHALFPYTSTVPRGVSPGLSGTASMRDGLSAAASPGPASTPLTSTAQKRSYARIGSPLNPDYPAQGERDDVEMSGMERARKKQMVWDPARGLVSRDRLEKEKERDAPPMPKNEAERILEVLEGMGRTPLGEAKRGAVRPNQINVPAPSSIRPARSSNGPAAPAPYGARRALSTSEGAETRAERPGKGLQSVLRAREERRRALLEQEREERERERLEAEERERRREERRREMEELGMDEEAESIFSQDEEERPRRKTRSMAAGKGKNLEPPTPARRSTRAATKAKSPSPLPTPKRKGKDKQIGEAEEQGDDVRMAAPSTKRAASKSPAPPSEPSKKARAGSPTPPTITFPPHPVAIGTSSARSSSLRPGKSHTSRQHTASSKVFSAREEDLPPIDEDALAKIQMPAMKFPEGFSFGAMPAAAPAKKEEPKKDDEKKAEEKKEPTSLLGRLGSVPSATAAAPASDKLTFSFGSLAAPAALTSAPKPSTPAFSFGARASTTDSVSKPADAPSLFKPTPSSDLFSAKIVAATSTSAAASAFSFATPSTGTTAPSLFASTDGGDKPNFFGSILKDKSKEPSPPPKTTSPPSFSFGAATPVVKPTEVITPEAENGKEKEKEKSATPTQALVSAAPVNPNPFAAFGKPVSEIVKEAQQEKTGEGEQKDEAKEEEAKKAETPKALFAFGAAAKTDEKKDVAPLFGFNPAASTSTSAASPFAFGAPKAADDASKPTDKPAAPFAFGSPAPAPTAATPMPTFTFGTTPATPTADEKKSATAPAAPSFSFGALTAPAASTADDADGDSGMEDEAEPEAAKPAIPSPAPFAFGSAAPSTSTAGGLFGSTATSSSGFTFGATAVAAEKNEPAPSPFGTPAAPGTSLFGAGASSAAKPFAFGSPSPSPAPPSPAPAAPSFTFGQPSSASGPAPSPFAFGASSSSSTNPNPFGTSTAPASPAATAAPSFAFGAPSGASASPAPTSPFAFGASTNPSSTMGSSLSAPGAPAASPFGAPSAGSFVFGASTSQPATPTASATSSFNFGRPSTSTSAGAAPFTFGASAGGPASPFGAPSPAAGAGSSGFGFGAPTASGATTPTGGLFNLGSGGDEAPKSSGRPIRPMRKPRR